MRKHEVLIEYNHETDFKNDYYRIIRIKVASEYEAF